MVYECLDDPGQKPEASQTLAVVEVSSPGTVREDLTDKRIQYAAAGIPLYLLIMLDDPDRPLTLDPVLVANTSASNRDARMMGSLGEAVES